MPVYISSASTSSRASALETLLKPPVRRAVRRRSGTRQSRSSSARSAARRRRITVNAATGEIEELDLARALREIPDEQRGWQTEKRTVQCQSCQAVSVFDPERVGQNCDFCGSPALVDYEEIKAPIRPQSLLPFKVTDASVREQIRKWYASKWLAPGKLKSRALIDTVHGVYIPYWTFDAQVVCPWDADAGHYYYTTETYREGGQTQTRQVRHTRWVPASGHVEHFFDDEPVPARRACRTRC